MERINESKKGRNRVYGSSSITKVYEGPDNDFEANTNIQFFISSTAATLITCPSMLKNGLDTF